MLFRPVRWRILFICCSIVSTKFRTVAETGSIYEKPQLLTASIYARNSEPPRLLFKFRRTVSQLGSTVKVLREYLYPDGREAAREEVTYDGNALKSYELDELQTGSVGTVKVNEDAKEPGKVQVAFQYNKDSSHKARNRVTTEAVGSGALVNDMMGAFLSANFDKLASGQKLNCHYIVVSRKETVGLSFTRQSETTYHGRDAVILKMQPTNPLISILVDPLYFTVEKAAPHRVLEYTGRTTPKINVDGHWKDLDAVTVFEW